jgi:hypothetical protein
MFLISFKFPARSEQVEHCFLSRTLDRTSYKSYCRNISCRMARLAETLSNIEVRSVIRFLRLKGTSPAEIHRQLVGMAIRGKLPGLLQRGIVLLHDNATPHTANCTALQLGDTGQSSLQP